MIKNSYIIIITIKLSVLFAILCSCSTPLVADRSLKVKRLVFLNQTSRPLKNVRIYVAKTREFVSCNTILANSECSMGFPLREYQGNSFEVSWLDGSEKKSVSNIRVTIPDNFNKERPVNAVITFTRQGEFAARLQP